MRAVVTGAAGFIGSRLAEYLVQSDAHVVGIDCLTDYYDVAAKRANLTGLRSSPRFEFVYGNAYRYPTSEEDLPRPFSPYGVTKLAAEHLCCLYAANWGIPTVALRYFSVYGPRQRPDMAMHRLIQSALHGSTFRLFGGGDQVRDFTYVDDVVSANVAAAAADTPPGSVINVAGGSNVSMHDVVALIGQITGTAPIVESSSREAGDVSRTGGSSDLARELLSWEPRFTLREGLSAQVEWARQQGPPPARQAESAER